MTPGDLIEIPSASKALYCVRLQDNKSQGKTLPLLIYMSISI